MTKLRMHYDLESGWQVDVEFALKPLELERIIDYTLDVQQKRVNSMSNGDKKEQALNALNLLRFSRGKAVKQNFIGTSTEKELFLSENRRIK